MPPRIPFHLWLFYRTIWKLGLISLKVLVLIFFFLFWQICSILNNYGTVGLNITKPPWCTRTRWGLSNGTSRAQWGWGASCFGRSTSRWQPKQIEPEQSPTFLNWEILYCLIFKYGRLSSMLHPMIFLGKVLLLYKKYSGDRHEYHGFSVWNVFFSNKFVSFSN